MATTIDVSTSVTIEGKISRFARTYQVDETLTVRDLDIPAGSTDKEITFAPGLFAAMSFLQIFTDGAMTLKVGPTSGAPDWTAVLTSVDGDSLLLSGAALTALKGTGITKLFVTTANDALVRHLTCLSGGDITP